MAPAAAAASDDDVGSGDVDVYYGYALFDAIVARKPLPVIRAIVKERPQSVRQRPPVRRHPTRRRRRNGWTPGALALHVAVDHGLPGDAVRFLHRCHPRALRERDGDGRVPLHYLGRSNRRRDAANELSLQTVRYLVREYPESLRQKDGEGWLVLHAAAANDNLSADVIRFLVEQYPPALQELGGRGRLPLMAALEWSTPPLDKIRYLVEQFPAALRSRDHEGRLPIHAAAANSGLLLEHIRCLVGPWPESARERDGRGRLPLHLAAGRSDHEHSLPVVRHLLDAHPESIRDGGGGDLAVHAAIQTRGPLDLIRLLVLRCPECLQVWAESGSLALHMAVRSGVSFEVLELLVEQCPQAVREAERDGNGRIALHLMAARLNPHPDKLDLLLRAWPESVLFQDGAGQTALHVCAIDAPGPGNVYHRSYRFDAAYDATLRLLCERGAGALKVRDARGHVPLHILLMRRTPDPALVRFLVEAWPRSALVPTADGRYPLFVAAENHGASLDVMYYLVKQWPGHYFLRQR